MKFLSSVLMSVLMIPAVGMAGSISGGGGGTVPANPVGSAAIVEILRDSRTTLLMYFRNLDSENPPMSEAVMRRLYKGTQTIYDVINETAIEAQLSAPCRDGDGKEVDGSIFTASGGICISSLRLGDKLERTNAFSQTVALVAHELSHKLGFSEDEATELQNDMLDRLEENNVSAQSAGSFARSVAESASDAAQAAEWFIHFADVGDWDLNCKNGRWLDEKFSKFLGSARSGLSPLSTVPQKDSLIDVYGTKAWGIVWASCGQAQPPLREYLDEQTYASYSEAFAGQIELTVSEFRSKMWGFPAEPMGGAIKMRLINSGAAAKAESTDIHQHLSEMRDRAWDVLRPSQLKLIP